MNSVLQFVPLLARYATDGLSRNTPIFAFLNNAAKRPHGKPNSSVPRWPHVANLRSKYTNGVKWGNCCINIGKSVPTPTTAVALFSLKKTI